MNILSSLQRNAWGKLLVVLAGASLVLAFSPFHFWWLAFIIPAILPIFLTGRSAKSAFMYGWLFGLGYFGAGISWIYVSIHVWGNLPMLPAGLITFSFVAIMAIFPAAQSAMLNYFFPRATISRYILAFPIMWVLFDWLRGWVLTGFPWLYLGHSQTDSVLRGFLPLIGTHGMTILILTVAGLLAFCLHQQRLRYFIAILIGFSGLYAGGDYLTQQQWTHSKGTLITASLIQPNLPEGAKWQADYLPMMMELYDNLSAAHADSDIIIWPEGAMPLDPSDMSEYLDYMSNQASDWGSAILTGILIRDASGQRFYNSLLGLGEAKGQYHKEHLVIFGEYTPLEAWLAPILRSWGVPLSIFTRGPQTEATIAAKSLAVIPFICYDIVYTDVMKRLLNEGDVLVGVNDMSWFGDSIAVWQLLQIAQVRALEAGRYFLFSANDGVSAIIKPDGSIQTASPHRVRTVLTDSFYAMQGLTPWAKGGAHWVWLWAFFGLLLAFWRQKRA